MKKIKLLLLDVDGVQTDGGLYYTDGGDKFKEFNVRDGIGIKRALALGVDVGVISHSSNNRILEERCRTLGIKRCYVGLRDKVEIFYEWMEEITIERSQTAFIGDDVNDFGIIRLVGFSACPNDAVEIVKKQVDSVLETKGGQGVVREFVDRFIQDDENWVFENSK